MFLKRKYHAFSLSTTLVIVLFVFLPVHTHAATPAELKAKYTNALVTGNKVKVLIVPGHDDDYWGTEFGDIREGDITVAIGQYLYNYLKNDPHLDVTISRTQLTGYTDTFKNYFVDHRQDILDFIAQSKTTQQTRLANGEIHLIDNAPHADARPEVALRLYGINKWANENQMDIVIHLHINDEGGRAYGQVGDYKGFTIYVPDSQYHNAPASAVMAEAMYRELLKKNDVSNFPPESRGVVEDQDLIATGARDTATAATALIEYGYIYEPQFRSLDIQEAVTKSLAQQTFLGLHSFFGDRDRYASTMTASAISPSLLASDTTKYLPYTWTTALQVGSTNIKAINALQAALTKEGTYSCGVIGKFGPCTEKGLIAFQKKYKISQTGTLGPITRKKLNSLYSS